MSNDPKNSFTEVTDENFEKKVLNNSLPVIVIFERNFSGAAHIMKLILKKINNDYGSRVEIYRYNMDKNLAASNCYRVRNGMAVLVFYNSRVVSNTGVISSDALKNIIDAIIRDTDYHKN